MEEEQRRFNFSKSKSRGIQTLYRSTFRTQINLIQIADNKANMIIGINAMIITVLMGIISTGIIFSSQNSERNTVLIFPLVFIILTSLVTAVLAIRAAKPRVLKNKKMNSQEDEKTSLLFFGNIWNLSTKEYLSRMEKLMESPKDIYQCMMIDIHNQARVLHRKYQLLRMAYIVFMVGFTISIAAFLLSWLIT